MTKNIKRMFFVLTLVTLLATVSAVCAADNTNSTITTDSCVSDVASVSDTTSDTIAAEPATTSDDNKVDTKTIEKVDKNLKTTTKTVEVNNYDELTTAINNAVNDADNEEYVINLNDGTYQTTSNIVLNTGDYTPHIIINGNNQSLTANNARRYVRFNNGCDVTLDNVSINHLLQNSGNNLIIRNSIINSNITNSIEMNLTIINSTLNSKITNNGNLTLSNDVTFGENFIISDYGQIIMNDYSKLTPYLSEYNGDYTIENATLTTEKINYGNLTIKNSTLNCIIHNVGNLTLSDDVIFGENFEIVNQGTLITNKTELSDSLEGDLIVENKIFKYLKNINGNITLINCTLESMYYEYGMYWFNKINNAGNISLINCTLKCNLNNTGNLIIEGNKFPDGTLYNYGKLELNNVCWLNITGWYSPTSGKSIMSYSEFIINNSTFSSISSEVSFSIESGNLTMSDCKLIDFNGSIQGHGRALVRLNNINMKNNGFISFVLDHIPELYMTNCIFENCSSISYGLNNSYINNCSFINNTKVISSNNTYINSSIFINNTDDTIFVEKNCTIKNSTFENNTLINGYKYGAAINLSPHGDNTIIITDNIFKNNYIDAYTGRYSPTYDTSKSGYGTDISLGISVKSNNFTGNNNNVTITNNQFINSQTNQKAGSIFIHFNESCQNNSLTITGNTFDNVKSQSETIIHNNTQNVIIQNNTFKNCIIDLDEFTLFSQQDNQTIRPDTTITLNIKSTLSHPEYYDPNILSNYEYQIFINNENKYNTTENTFTFTLDKYGPSTIYVITPAINNKTNDIIVTVTKKELVIKEINAKVGDKINITAQIKLNDKINNQINTGKISFKVNGKTVKDTNGKVIYAKVVNGTATIENYEVPSDWAKEGTTIQAVYSGSTQCEKLTSEKTNITIVAEEPTLTTEDITATAGDKITLKATIIDNNKIINTGKIVFKINGKTVKDENGKVIYAKVVNNTVEFEYTLPESMKAGSYNITGTFISCDYNRLSDSKILTVTA